MEVSHSVFMVTSTDPDNPAFGTSFVIHQDKGEQAVYLLTCAHVVRDIGGREQVSVMGQQATIAAYGDPDGGGVDLAVLRVAGVADLTVMPMVTGVLEGEPFVAPGFQTLKPNYLLRPIHGNLGHKIELDSRGSTARVAAWDLIVKDDYTLQPGYSGSPVVRDSDSCVLAVVSNRVGDGQKGIAISIEGLKAIWPDAPSDFIITDSGPQMPNPSDSAPSVPEEGLYLARLINPQIAGSNQIVTTVWLSVRGASQYVVDSIRVKNSIAGIAGPMGDVAMPPDAGYRFTYADGTDRIEALNPALSIGAATRSEASFTLSTAPEKPLHMVSSLVFWLHYHKSDGETGKLFLCEAYWEGRFLSGLLGRKVKIFARRGRAEIEQIVAPPGRSAGIDDRTVTDLQFVRLNFGWNHSDACTRTLEVHRAEWKPLLAKRAALHQAIVQMQKTPGLAAKLQSSAQSLHALTTDAETATDTEARNTAQQQIWQCEEEMAVVADLCGAIGDEIGTKALLDLLTDAPLNEAGLTGLCIRHIARPDNVLADYVLRSLSQANHALRLEKIVEALACFPAGRWAEALLEVSRFDSDAFDALRVLQDRFDAETTGRAIDHCWQSILQGRFSADAVQLLVALTGSCEEVIARLAEMPLAKRDREILSEAARTFRFCPTCKCELKDSSDGECLHCPTDKTEFLFASPAYPIYLAGTFSDWKPLEMSYDNIRRQWVKRILLPAGRYAYKFIEQDEWKTDPSNPEVEVDGNGNRNSILLVP